MSTRAGGRRSLFLISAQATWQSGTSLYLMAYVFGSSALLTRIEIPTIFLERILYERRAPP